MKILFIGQGKISEKLELFIHGDNNDIERYEDIRDGISALKQNNYDAAVILSDPGNEIKEIKKLVPIVIFQNFEEDSLTAEDVFYAQGEPALMVLIVDLNSDEIVYVNEVVVDVLGYDPNMVLGKRFFEFIDIEDKEKIDNFLREKIEKGKQRGTFIDRVIAANGEVKHIENQYTVLKDLDEKPDKLLILAKDKNKRERYVDISEEGYRTIFETTGTAMAIIEENGTISKVNKRFTELSGYSKEEIEGRVKWTEFVDPGDLERMMKYHIARRKDPSSIPTKYDFIFHDREGVRRVIHLNIDVIPNTKKSVASMIDTTKNRQIEDISRGLIESRQVGLIVVQDEKIVLSNPCFQRLSGYSEEEVLGRGPLSFVPENERLDVSVKAQEMLRGERKEPYEHGFLKADGSLGWVLEQVSSIIYEGRKAALITFIENFEKPQ